MSQMNQKRSETLVSEWFVLCIQRNNTNREIEKVDTNTELLVSRMQNMIALSVSFVKLSFQYN